MYPDHNGSDLVLKFNHSSEDNSTNIQEKELQYFTILRNCKSCDTCMYSYKIRILVGFGVKHLQFSYFLRISLTIKFTVFHLLCYIDLFIGFYFTPHYYFVGSSTIQRYKLISHPCNPGGIIINIILLFYLASYFLIIRFVRDLVCYKLII